MGVMAKNKKKRKQHEAEGKRLESRQLLKADPSFAGAVLFSETSSAEHGGGHQPDKTLLGSTNVRKVPSNVLIWQKRSESNGCF
jgi:hypothetical protein